MGRGKAEESEYTPNAYGTVNGQTVGKLNSFRLKSDPYPSLSLRVKRMDVDENGSRRIELCPQVVDTRSPRESRVLFSPSEICVSHYVAGTPSPESKGIPPTFLPVDV